MKKHIELKNTNYKPKANPTIFRRAKLGSSNNTGSINEEETTMAEQMGEQIILTYPTDKGLTMYILGKEKAILFKQNLDMG